MCFDKVVLFVPREMSTRSLREPLKVLEIFPMLMTAKARDKNSPFAKRLVGLAYLIYPITPCQVYRLVKVL